ncbi:RecQ family ATP-dependent DNA helicase [Candidatus Ulvibacter alkanivorans]|uniref:RecQ family ATP-dependent DNA helicase n=1 Tax=Candidatus Ulvibacter alkanivorans TaxID=2267620 RepID=UPI000DF46518|nr:ATP-dependent DNA helicase RecQ [Candidatus Ulvibacter alkanivorans]
MKSPLHILNHYWGHAGFRPKQAEIIESILNGKDTVALLPTGGGKSICFQVPAMAQDGICIVVSPLVALMQDQVQALKNIGIKALSITGGISIDTLRTLLDNAIYGNYKFLYVSPERLQQEMVQNAIREMPVNLIAVDEAHCISQWGNDFRPAYKNITVLRELHPLVPIIALTATATPEVLTDTIAELQLELPEVIQNSFVRPNIAYRVYKEDDKLYRVEQLLKNKTGSAIVYVRSRKTAVETSNHLTHLGIPSTFYHGGVTKEEKKKRLEQWLRGSVKTMVATNAFGMGIDKADVRLVIHIQLPESLEGYFQEAGRAGRDGQPAAAILLYNSYDKKLVQKQFIEALPGPDDLKLVYRKLNNYFQIPYGEGEFTAHSFNFTEFCNTYDLNTMLTYNALNSLDRLAIIQLSKEFGRRTALQFLVPSEKLLDYFKSDASISVVGKTILRMYGGIFETSTAINLELVAKKTGLNVPKVIEALQRMQRDELVDLSLFLTDASITFLVPREDDKTINVIAKEVKQLNKKKEQQVASVLRYIENDQQCRSAQLVSYFGEEVEEPCGICSVCASQETTVTKKEAQLISEKIMILLEENELSSRSLAEKSTFTETKILYVLRLLIDHGRVQRNNRNQYYKT